MTFEAFTAVWTPLSVLLAIIAGIGYGILVARIANDPTYSAGTATAFRIALIATIFAVSAGLMFFALQTLGTYLSGDPNWPRVMSRLGQWVVFSAAIGVTTWLLVWRSRSGRRRRAHERAVALEDIP